MRRSPVPLFITTLKRSLGQGNVFYNCLSVILFTGEGVRDWTKGVQSVYISTVFYAPDLFLENVYLPQAPRGQDSRSTVGLRINCILYLNLRQRPQSEAVFTHNEIQPDFLL